MPRRRSAVNTPSPPDVYDGVNAHVRHRPDERGRGGRAGGGRAGHAGACVRAGLFAVLGTLLATFGHHAIAEGRVPWPLVGLLVVSQFAVVWPLARRRPTLVATVVCTLAVQGVLHVTLSAAAGGEPAAGMPR